MAAPNPPFLFIVGDSDPGRMLLRQAFDAHPEVAVAPNYPFIYRLAKRRAEFEVPGGREALARLIARDDRFAPWGLDADGLAEVLGPEPIDYPDAVRRTYAALTRDRGARISADCSNWTLRQIGVLAMLFEEARFVHVVEDPRTVCTRRVREGDSLGRAAEQWRSSIELALDAAATLPADRYIQLRTEELVEDPRGHAKTIAEHLGLGIDPDGFVDVEPEPDDAPPLLGDEIRTVELLVGPVMKRLGYDLRTNARPLNYRERKRLIGELQAGRRAGLDEPLRDRIKRVIDRSPALGRLARRVAKAVRR